MYVFDHFICFYSAVFNFSKKRRIPMRVGPAQSHSALPAFALRP
jgi:hypothetical protein